MNRIGWVDYVAPLCQAVFAAAIAGYAALIAFPGASVWFVVVPVAAVVAAAVLVITVAAMRRAATEEADVRAEIHEENDEEIVKGGSASGGPAPVVTERGPGLHAVG